MYHSSNVHQRGLTVLEIFSGLGLLVVLLYFAVPSFSTAPAKAELEAAVKNLEFSIHAARNAARLLDTDIIMHVQQGRDEKYHYVSFSMPALAPTAEASATMSTVLQTFAFPENIRLVSSEEQIRFDSHGMVDVPVQVLLVSSLDDAVNRRLLIQ